MTKKKFVIGILTIFLVFVGVCSFVQIFDFSYLWQELFAYSLKWPRNTIEKVYTITVNDIKIPLPYKNIEAILDIDYAKILRPELFLRAGKDDKYHYVILLQDGVTIAVAAYNVTSYNIISLVNLLKTWSQYLVQKKFVLSHAHCLKRHLFLVVTDEQKEWLTALTDTNLYLAFSYFEKLLQENGIVLIIITPT